MSEESAEVETDSCPGCLEPLLDSPQFCPNCGIPTDGLAELDPIKAIRSQGEMFRRGANKPNFIIVVGIWALLLPLAIGTVLVGTYSIYTLPWVSGLFLLYAAILYRVTRNYFRFRKTVERDDGIDKENE